MVVTSELRTHKVMEAAIRELMGAGTPPRFKFQDTYASIEFPDGYTVPAQATLEAKYNELLALEEDIQKTAIEGDLEVGTANIFVDTETGRVGIGNTNPGYNLDVNGTSNVGALTAMSLSVAADTDYTGIIGRAKVGNVGHTDYAGFAHYDHATGLNYALLQGSSGDTYINSATGQKIYFRENNADKMVLFGGNVGIGKTDPAYKLDVTGDIYATGNITGYSDKRAKSDIQKIENALDKIEQLNGYTFTMNDKRYTGVIAQEVLPVLPEAVTGSEETHYAVAYGNMMGLIIEAIKELKKKVEQQ